MTNVELDYVHQESYRLKDILRRRGVLEPFVALAIDVLNHQTVQMERKISGRTLLHRLKRRDARSYRAFRDISKNSDFHVVVEFRREGVYGHMHVIPPIEERVDG
jgi:hypothetical protein